MQTLTRKQILNVAMQQSVQWLQACLDNPGAYMTPRSVLMVRVALRRKTR